MRQQLWLLPNKLSLDAPLVAVLWQSFFADSFHVTLTMAARVALGFAVWAVYIADRLLDVHRAEAEVATARHQFHQRHRTAMTLLLAVVVAVAASMAVQIRPAVFRAGLVTAACVFAYFFAVHRTGRASRAPFSAVSKEIAASLLFALGTILVPLARSDEKLPIIAGGLAFFCACLANLVAIETFEWQRHLRDAPPPAPTLALGNHYLAVFGTILAGVVIAAPLTVPETGLHPVLAAVGIAISILVLLVAMRKRLSTDAFRVLADAALLSPIPVWFFFPAL